MTERTDGALATLLRWYRLALIVLAAPVVFADYFRPSTGAEYDVGLAEKLLLLGRMARNNARIPTGSTFLEHLVVATKVLELPPGGDGRLVECGCYMGGSTANLSLVAGLVDRRLDVFDSFEGMPEPADGDETHVLVDSEQVHEYAEGSWRAAVEDVRANVAEYGDADVVTLHRGYFGETLPEYDEECALVFVDAGLRESAETCLEHLWPRLVDGGYLFTHDVKHAEISSLFFEPSWWHERLDRDPPGLVGAGNGLGLHPGPNGFTSMLGYTVKNPDRDAFERVAETGSGSNCVDTSLTGGECGAASDGR